MPDGFHTEDSLPDVRAELHRAGEELAAANACLTGETGNDLGPCGITAAARELMQRQATALESVRGQVDAASDATRLAVRVYSEMEDAAESALSQAEGPIDD